MTGAVARLAVVALVAALIPQSDGLPGVPFDPGLLTSTVLVTLGPGRHDAGGIVQSTDGHLLVAATLVHNGTREGVVAKVTEQGELQWRTSLGPGTSAHRMGLGPAGGIFVAGSAGWDAAMLVARLDADGALEWVRTARPSQDRPIQVARGLDVVPALERVYLGGYTQDGPHQRMALAVFGFDGALHHAAEVLTSADLTERAEDVAVSPDAVVLLGTAQEKNIRGRQLDPATFRLVFSFGYGFGEGRPAEGTAILFDEGWWLAGTVRSETLLTPFGFIVGPGGTCNIIGNAHLQDLAPRPASSAATADAAFVGWTEGPTTREDILAGAWSVLPTPASPVPLPGLPYFPGWVVDAALGLLGVPPAGISVVEAHVGQQQPLSASRETAQRGTELPDGRLATLGWAESPEGRRVLAVHISPPAPMVSPVGEAVCDPVLRTADTGLGLATCLVLNFPCLIGLPGV